MKEMFKFQLAILMLVVLSSCSAMLPGAETELFPGQVYGVTPEDPLSLHASFEKEATKKAEAYFNDLRTPEGEKLQLVGKTRVPNPNYKKPKIILYNWITGEQINQCNGRFLVKYQLATESGKDRVDIYVNHFIRKDPQIPDSLVLASQGSH